jgi:hypothetical protein
MYKIDIISITIMAIGSFIAWLLPGFDINNINPIYNTT